MADADYLLLGGGLASGAAAKAIRDRDPNGSIVLLGLEDVLPYHRPPMSKAYLRGEEAFEKTLVEQPAFYRDRNVEAVLGTRVVRVNLPARRVEAWDGRTWRFEKLLIATGARVRTLDVPGSDLQHVRYLRTVHESDAIRAEFGEGRRLVTVGGSFIGLEVAASARQRGCEVTILNLDPYPWANVLDEGSGRFIERELRSKGITVRNGVAVRSFEGRGGQFAAVNLDGGERVAGDFAVIGVGVLPNVELAERAGLRVDDGIVVNERLEAAPGIYAAGDAARAYEPAFGKHRRVEHWDRAINQGRIAGANMAGEARTDDGLSYFFSDLFDLGLEFVGDFERLEESRMLAGGHDDRSFAVGYGRGGSLVAGFLCRRSGDERKALERMIKERTPLAKTGL